MNASDSRRYQHGIDARRLMPSARRRRTRERLEGVEVGGVGALPAVTWRSRAREFAVVVARRAVWR